MSLPWSAYKTPLATANPPPHPIVLGVSGSSRHSSLRGSYIHMSLVPPPREAYMRVPSVVIAPPAATEVGVSATADHESPEISYFQKSATASPRTA